MERRENMRKSSASRTKSMFRVIRKSLGIIFSLTIIASAWTYILMNKYMPNKYIATSSIAIIPKGEIGSAFNENVFVEAADKFYGLLDSEIFREMVWKDINDTKQEGDALNIISEEESNLIFFQGESLSPKRAFGITKAAINNYKKMFDYTKDDYSLDTFAMPSAERITEKSNNSLIITLAVGALVLFGGILIVALCYVFSDKVYTTEQAKRQIDGSLLESITFQKKSKRKGLLVTQTTTKPIILKEYRNAAMKIDYSMKRARHNTLLVSSVQPSEGKSTVALNLAITLAQLNNKVLLLDLDLRHPNLSNYSGIPVESVNEISNVLAEGNNKGADYFKQFIEHNEELGIDFIFGSTAVQKEDKTMMAGLETLLATLKTEYDYIIMDTSPVGIVKETYVKASLAEDVLLVVRQGETTSRLVNGVIDDLKTANIKFIGFILNGIPLKS